MTKVIEATDKGQIPKGQYGALLIDEGHDFEADWLRLVVQMVDPDEGSLLLLYDDAQSIYKKKKAIDFSLSSALEKARIPVMRLIDSAEKKTFDPSSDTVKVMTMHSSKGLEFPLVVIPGVGQLPGVHEDLSAEARLLYVAMTRSTDKLLLTASQTSAFVELLHQPQAAR